MTITTIRLTIKSIFITLILLLQSGCQWRPSYDDMVQHFETHRNEFNAIARLACEIGARKKLRTSTDELTNPDLQALLQKTDVEIIEYKELDGQCVLWLQYYAVGFSGGAWVQEFAYNLPSPLPYDEAFHTPDAIRERKQGAAFDMFLGDGWYFSLRSN